MSAETALGPGIPVGRPAFHRPERQSAGTGMSVCLVHPQLRGAETKNRLKYRESLALGYLTAALEQHGYPVGWVNAELERLSPETVAERVLADTDTGVLGISLKSQRALSTAVDIAGLVKISRPDVHVTLGGLFPSSGGLDILRAFPAIDSCVKGEGESAIVDLAAAVERGEPLSAVRGLAYRHDGEPTFSGERERIADLDAVPFPVRRDLAYMAAHGVAGATNANMLATRGCYAACTFCSIHQIYGDRLVMRRSPRNVVDELARLVADYHVSRVAFIDDIFIHPSPTGIAWAFELADLIDEAKLPIKFFAEMRADTVREDLIARLVEVGLYKMFIGIESGVDSVLVRMDKGCTTADNERALQVLRTNVGLKPYQINLGYIMFEPDMTLAELRAQYEWLRGSGHATVQNLQNRMNVYWGTPQYTRMEHTGRLTPTSELGDRWSYDFSDPLVSAVERVVRQFHLWFGRSCTAQIEPAREAFFERVSEEILVVPAEPRIADVLSQLCNRINDRERACYLRAFDHLFAAVDRDGAVPESALYDIKAATEDDVVALKEDAALLAAFADQLLDLVVVPAEEAAPGTAWLDGERTMTVWLRDVPPDLPDTVRAELDIEYSDRFAHTTTVFRRARVAVEAALG